MVRTATLILLAATLLAGACGIGDQDPDRSSAEGVIEDDTTTTEETASPSNGTYEIEVWADNWMAVYVNGELIGEDSVSIATERSFNAETFTFEASEPFTIAIEAKDFKETDSGLEYIGEPNQQMGDGGLIAQVTDLDTDEVVLVTDDAWSLLVIHQAPLNPSCESDPDPDSTCEFTSTNAPGGWSIADFDDSAWTAATEWSASAVDPKGGYDDIDWNRDAAFVWGGDLEIDNTVLLRATTP